MNENIQQSGSEVSVIIYNSPLPPRYFRFSKKFIRTLFVVIPFTLGLTFLTLFIWGIGTRLEEMPAPKMPEVLSGPESKILALEEEVKGLQQTNLELTEKLASVPPAAGAQEEVYLMGIKKPYGMQNLISEKRVSVDQIELIQDPNKVSLKFQIISTNPEQRVAGYVLVFMISESGLMVYPASANASLNSGVKYSEGETFAVSRLRPTNAEFLQRLSGKSVKFNIYIFSREGDLLLTRETESFSVKEKL